MIRFCLILTVVMGILDLSGYLCATPANTDAPTKQIDVPTQTDMTHPIKSDILSIASEAASIKSIINSSLVELRIVNLEFTSSSQEANTSASSIPTVTHRVVKEIQPICHFFEESKDSITGIECYLKNVENYISDSSLSKESINQYIDTERPYIQSLKENIDVLKEQINTSRRTYKTHLQGTGAIVLSFDSIESSLKSIEDNFHSGNDAINSGNSNIVSMMSFVEDLRSIEKDTEAILSHSLSLVKNHAAIYIASGKSIPLEPAQNYDNFKRSADSVDIKSTILKVTQFIDSLRRRLGEIKKFEMDLGYMKKIKAYINEFKLYVSSEELSRDTVAQYVHSEKPYINSFEKKVASIFRKSESYAKECRSIRDEISISISRFNQDREMYGHLKQELHKRLDSVAAQDQKLKDAIDQYDR